MARPQKFRLTPDEVLEPQHARKLAGHVSEIELFRKEIEKLQQQVADIYDAADEDGFDKKFVRKAVAKRAKDSGVLAAEEQGLAAYEMAIEKGMATRARERNPEHDPETGEITEPQPAPQTERDLTDPKPLGQVATNPEAKASEDGGATVQHIGSADDSVTGDVSRASDGAGPVATIQPETATSFAGAEAHGVDAKASDSNAVSTVPLTIDGNANTGGHDEVPAQPVPVVYPGRRQSEPASEVAHNGDEHQRTGRVETNEAPAGRVADESPASIIYPAPGVVVMETCPPEGALAHPYAACWPVRDIDVSEGVREPIVKIGKLILDGRGRMFAARGWDGGKGREYPVVQYYGTDPLMDCIRWNLASRPGIHSHNLKLIAGKLAKLEPTRADEIMQAFGLEVAEAAE